jgi:hypothetical protein
LPCVGAVAPTTHFRKEDRLKLIRIIVAIAMVLFLTSPVIGSAWEPALRVEMPSPSCTVEEQKCLDRLNQRLDAYGRIRDWNQIEDALLDLQKTHPECALLLQGTDFLGR